MRITDTTNSRINFPKLVVIVVYLVIPRSELSSSGTHSSGNFLIQDSVTIRCLAHYYLPKLKWRENVAVFFKFSGMSRSKCNTEPSQ